MKKLISLTLACLALTACATTTPPSYDYTQYRAEHPKSILIVPALNNTLNVNAPEYFLSTLSIPVSQRGYYVFPAHMVKRTLEENGLADAGLIHEADASRMGDLFGCDAALYVSIDLWESQYAVIATSTNVAFTYQIRSCNTGEVLWDNEVTMTYSPQASSSGNFLADMVAQAVVSAIEKAAPNYMPLARMANAQALYIQGTGIPAGPYLPEIYNTDTQAFPSGTSIAAEADTNVQ